MTYQNVTRTVIESFAPCPAWTDVGGYVEIYPTLDVTWPEWFDLPEVTDEHKLWAFTRPIVDIASQQQGCIEILVANYYTANDSLICQENKDFYEKILAGTETSEDLQGLEDHITHSEPACENYAENYLAYRMAYCLSLGGLNGITGIKDSSNYTELLTIAKNLDWGA